MLIIGCGDVGLRLAQFTSPDRELYGIVRRPDAMHGLSKAGIKPLLLDIDSDDDFPELSPQAHWVYLAPPSRDDLTDSRLARWLARVPPEHRPARVVYISTSGVYGDHAGGWVDESTPVNPQTDRAKRRVDAERQLDAWCGQYHIDLLLLRVPGIIGVGRESLTRLQSGEPIIHPDEAPYTNLVDADYLAKAIVFLASKAEAGIYNISDREPMTVCDRYMMQCQEHGIPLPDFISMQEAEKLYSPMRMSYLKESRRLKTDKLKRVFKG